MVCKTVNVQLQGQRVKYGDRLITLNYRHVSLLTSSSKVFEKLTYARFYKHTYTNYILINVQYGFRNNTSTEEATCNLIMKF